MTDKQLRTLIISLWCMISWVVLVLMLAFAPQELRVMFIEFMVLFFMISLVYITIHGG